jgi:hypothetical protein
MEAPPHKDTKDITMAAPPSPIKTTPKPWPTHNPYVPPSTVARVHPSSSFCSVFGLLEPPLSTGLKVGLTVSASTDSSLSITILRAFGKRASSKIIPFKTTGSAVIAAGIVFTIPALLILGLDLDVLRTALIGPTGASSESS